MPGLVISIARIDLQGLVGKVAEYLACLFLIVLCLDVRGREESPLVAIGHHNNGYIIIFAALIETILVITDDIAVDARPETGKAHVTVAKLHRRHLAHLLDVLLLQMLLEGESLLLGTLLRSI